MRGCLMCASRIIGIRARIRLLSLDSLSWSRSWLPHLLHKNNNKGKGLPLTILILIHLFKSCLSSQFILEFIYLWCSPNFHRTWYLPFQFSDFFHLRHSFLHTRLLSLSVQFNSVQVLSRVWLFAIPCITARQASLSITNSRSSLRFTSIESVMPSSHLILCRPLLLLPPIPPSIREFSNESALRMRWPKYWSFSFSIIPSKEIPGLKLR